VIRCTSIAVATLALVVVACTGSAGSTESATQSAVASATASATASADPVGPYAAPDWVHPNEAGHAVLAKLLERIDVSVVTGR
jgi:hypothetical protein